MQFVVGYPKSGSSWIRAVVAAYAFDDVAPEDFVMVGREHGPLSKHLWSDLTPHHYQSSTPFALKGLDFGAEVRLRPAAMMILARDVSRTLERDFALVDSRHANCTVNGINLWNPQWTDRVVNPIRDPREVCCSLAAHFGTSYADAAAFMADPDARFPREEDLDEGATDDDIGEASGQDDEETDDEAPLHHVLLSWSNHVRSWFNSDDLQVLSVRYEDLQADPVEAFRAVFKFLDVPDLDDDRLEAAIESVRFDRMREAEEEHGLPGATGEQDYFFRSGKTEGWKEELPGDVAQTIEEDHGEMMEALGYV